MRIKFLVSSLVLAVILLSAQLYATDHFLYWKYRWFDTPMHLLGGIVIGALIVGLIGARKNSVLLYWLAVFALFIAWEIFEYVAHISHPQGSYAFDTAHDLVNDTLGAFIIYFTAHKSLWRSN